MTQSLATILDELGISVVPVTKQRALMETHAINTMERILSNRGETNLRDTLMSIVETKNHKRELVAPVIWSISDILKAHPGWFSGEKWFGALDEADIADMRAKAKTNKAVARPRQAIATMLLDHLRKYFDPEEQARLI
jgi:hypothetical protein